MRVTGRTSSISQLNQPPREIIMLVRRRTWFYRLAGQQFAHVITFRNPITASKVKEALRHTIGIPIELWGRSA
jgi:hypothetical protein